jgi:hypothetical protein
VDNIVIGPFKAYSLEKLGLLRVGGYVQNAAEILHAKAARHMYNFVGRYKEWLLVGDEVIQRFDIRLKSSTNLSDLRKIINRSRPLLGTILEDGECLVSRIVQIGAEKAYKFTLKDGLLQGEFVIYRSATNTRIKCEHYHDNTLVKNEEDSTPLVK